MITYMQKVGTDNDADQGASVLVMEASEAANEPIPVEVVVAVAATATVLAAGATWAIVSVVTAAGAGVVIAASALLAKYGLQARELEETNILTAETEEDRLLSEEVLRVKHAPDMSLMETVMHFTSLLYEEDDDDRPASPSINERKKSSPRVLPAKDSDVSQLDPHTGKNADVSPRSPRRRHPITGIERKRVINKAKRSLAWAQDADRPPVPGAEKMTHDQV